MNDSVEEWFQREILPHEAALVRFLGRKWNRAEDIQDIRHDIYVRILEAAAIKRPTSPRGFMRRGRGSCTASRRSRGF